MTMPRILSLNDVPDLLEICHVLMELSGYHHLYTTDADKALSILQQEPIDLFIQDIARPKMNGFEFYWLMKSKKELQDIPILIVSAWHPVVVTRLDPAGKAVEGLCCVEFKVTHPEQLQALSAVAGIKQANMLYVEGYLELPIQPEKFLLTISDILHQRSLLSLTEAEQALRREPGWALATQNVDLGEANPVVLRQWHESFQARLRDKLAHPGD
jgi:CheY-like chemotaxis protein